MVATSWARFISSLRPDDILLQIMWQTLLGTQKGEEGVVRIELHTDEVGAEATLTVSDDGRGVDLPAVSARRAGGGQGLELLRHLARQLGGDIEKGTPGRGTIITVRFPLVV